jgi:tRNA(His) guanylyltransferase
MKFDELDAKMRVFETAHDLIVLPSIYMVAYSDFVRRLLVKA